MEEVKTPLLDISALNEQFSNYSGGISLPNAPNIPFRGLNLSEDGGQSSSFNDNPMDRLMRDVTTSTPFDKNAPISRSLSEMTDERYPFFTPGDFNNEDAYAQGQGWASKMVSGVGKGLVLTGTTFLQTTGGLIYGAARAVNDGKFSSFYNNELTRALDDINKKMENYLPNYYTDAEKSAHWYSPSKLFSANFVWDGIVKNLGFAAGAALSGGVFASGIKALSQIPGLARLVSTGKMAEALAATEKGLLTSGKIASTYGKVGELSKGFLGSYSVLNPGGRAVVAGLATSGEAGIEAYHNMVQFRDERIQEYIDTYGMEPTGEHLEAINRDAEDVGNKSFSLNMALLTATNYIQFPKILGSSYAAEKGILNSAVRQIDDIVEEGGKFIKAAPAIQNKFLRGVNAARKYSFSATEAFEEGSQYAITVGTQDYYDKKYNGEERSILSSLAEGVNGVITTDEGMENVLIGGLSGAIMLGRGRYMQGKAKDINTSSAIKDFNKHKLSDFTKDTADSVVRGTALQQEREELLKQGNISDSKDVEADYIINYLSPRIKYGRFDLVTSELNDYKTLASTDEGFAQLQAEGKALETDTRESYLNRIMALERTAENVKSLYQSINIRYGGKVDEKGKPLYSSDVIDKMVYAASKVADYDVRIPQLTSKFIGANVNIEQVLQDVFEGKNDSYDAALIELEKSNLINKDELVQDFKDAAKLTIRRKQFLKEYEDIKNSPEAYQEKKAPIADETLPKETIKIKTNKGEKEVEIGTKYLVGQTVQYDDKGNEVYGAPEITIVRDNGDGTIDINDGKKIRTIKKEALENYWLVKPSTIENNKKAKYYKEHWNTVFRHWGITLKDGKHPTGRLKYSDKKNRLIFYYKDDNGKIVEKEVWNNMFAAKKGFTHGILEEIGTLTATQKKAKQEFIDDKTTLSDRLETRNRLITELYESSIKRIEEITATLEKNSVQLSNIQNQLEKSRLTEKGQPRKKYGKELRRTIDELTKLYDVIDNENKALTEEKLNLEAALPFFQDFVENMSEFPESSKEMLSMLKDDVENIEQQIEATDTLLKRTDIILQSIKETLAEALKTFNNYIKRFREKNPNLPTSIDALQEIFEKYYGEAGAEQFIADRGGFTNQILQFESDLLDVQEELNIPQYTGRVEKLEAQLSELQEQLTNLKNENLAKKMLLNKFETYLEEWKKIKEEENLLTKNKELQKEWLGRNTTDVQTQNEGTFEQDKKKDDNAVIHGTIPLTEEQNPNEVVREHHKRANRFGFRFNNQKFDKSKFKGVIVTKNTEDSIIKGLTKHLFPDGTEDDLKNIIALVIVRVNEDGSYTLVDEFGEIYTGDNPLDNAIYQVFPLPKLVNTKGTLFRETTKENVIAKLTKEYETWVSNQLKKTTLEAPVDIEVSFGIFDKVMNSDGTENTSVKTPATETGIVNQSEIEGKVVIDVPTTNDTQVYGNVVFHTPKGRPVLMGANGAVKLNNRHLNKKEAVSVFEAILQVAKNSLKNDEDSKAANNTLFDYLKSIIYWGFAKDRQGNRKPAGYNNIWFETSVENGIEATRLFISGKGKSIEFTPSKLMENKDEIIQLLQNIYMNVNNAKIKAINEKYYEYSGIDKDGKPILAKIWDNYQTYLLSTEGRNPEEIPLTTSVRPMDNKEDINRKGIYFVITPKVEKDEAPKPAQESSDILGRFTLDGTTENKIKIGEVEVGFTYKRGAPPATFKIVSIAQTSLKVGDKAIQFSVTDGKLNIPDGLSAEEISAIGEYANNLMIPAFQAFAAEAAEIKKAAEQAPKEEQKTEGDATDEEIEENNKKYNSALFDANDDTDVLTRLLSGTESSIVEDWVKFEQFLKEKFPHIPVYRVKNILKATNSKQALGQFRKAAIYIWKNAEEGTGYHEVFHAIWEMFTSPEERQSIINEFKDQNGSYVDRFGEEINYSEATDKQINEALAEELRDLMLYNKAPVRKEKNSWIGRMLKELWDFIKTFFGGEQSTSNIQQLFDKLNSGYYRDFIPYESELSYANKGIIDIDDAIVDNFSELREEVEKKSILPAYQRHEFIQDFTYITLSHVIETNKSLFTFSEKIDKKNLYEVLRKRVFDTKEGLIAKKHAALARYAAIKDTNPKDAELRKEEVKRINRKLYVFEKAVEKEWDSLIQDYEDQLSSYNIQFDENDEIALIEQDKTKDDPYGDATKIDQFRKANSAIKLLLATLPKLKMGNNGLTVERSSVGGVILIPLSEAWIKVKNTLYNATTPDDMLMKLGEMAIGNPNYTRLYRRLTKQSPSAERVDYSALDEDGIMLLSAFWSAMKAQNPDVTAMYILPTGQVLIGEASMANATRQSKRVLTSNLIDSIRKDNKYFTYNSKTGEYSAAKDKNGKAVILNADLSKNETYVKFLENLGITFKLSDINNISSDSLKQFHTAVAGLREALSVIENVKLLNTVTMDNDGWMHQLGAIKAIIENPEFDSTFFNISGERVQTYIGVNSLSNMYDYLTKVKTRGELENTPYKYLLTDTFSRGSVLLQRLFSKDGTKKTGAENILKPAYVDGVIDQMKNKKIPSQKVAYINRLLQEINHNVQGWYANLVPGNASMEHFVKLHDSDEAFLKEKDIDNNLHYQIFLDYLADEIDIVKEDRIVANDKKATELRFFKTILGEDLHKKVLAKIKNNTPTADILKMSGIIPTIDKFINEESIDLLNLLTEYGLITKDENGDTVVEGISSLENKTFSDKTLLNALRQISLNYMIANIELHKVLYSDPYLFTNELKYTKNFNSPRRPLLHGSDKLNRAMTEKWNKGYQPGDLGYIDMNKDYFRTVTGADVLSNDDGQLGYEIPWEETDGCGIIILQANKVFGIREGNWTEDNERQYRYDIAYEKFYKNIELSPKEKEIFDPAKKGKDNPGIPSTYTPRKPIVTGGKLNDRTYNDTVVDKYALFVYSFRILHQMKLDPNVDSNAIRLYNKMNNEKIDYMIFNTGRKIGAENVVQLYNDKGVITEEPFETEAQRGDSSLPQSIINIPFSIMSVQAEVPSKDINDTTTGSQMTKLATMDFLEAGVPVDFEPTLNFEDRYQKWNALQSEEERFSNSPIFKEIKHNQKLLETLIEEGMRGMLSELGISKQDGNYVIDDAEKLIAVLESQIKDLDANKNILRSLREFKNGQVVLEATPAYQQIRNILYSIADRAVISRKISGRQNVQMLSTFLESERIKTKEVKDKKTGKMVPVYHSSILKSYKNKDGERVAEIMVARWFNSPFSDEEILKQWTNEDGTLNEEGKKALSGIGFRIPTQKQNSIEHFVIKKFLPRDFKDVVVVPSAIVRKAGSDFDIDKLSLYLKNMMRDAKGRPMVVPFMGFEKEAKNELAIIDDEIIQDKIKITEEKIIKQGELQDLFGKIALGDVSDKTIAKWSAIFKEWFPDKVIDNKLSVALIEEIFMSRLESLGKKLDKLTNEDVQEAMLDMVYEKRYKQSLENEYIESLQRLVSNESNFDKLIYPNSADVMKDIGREVEDALGRKEIDYGNAGNMLSRRFMSSLRHAFVSGSISIGIAAVGQTGNAQGQRTLLYVDPSRKDNLKEKDQLIIDDGLVKFREFNSINKGDKKLATFSKTKDAKKQYFISDIISQFIDGFVDIAKGPWIILMGVMPNVTSSWLFLVRIGVPVRTVAFFMNQPIIREYLQMIADNGYKYLFIDQFVKELVTKYTPTTDIKSDITLIPTEAHLVDTVNKKIKGDVTPITAKEQKQYLTDQEKAEQIFMLKEFLKYAKMAEQLFYVTQGSNFDTARFNDPFIIFKKIKQLERARKTIISDVDEMMNASFIKILKDNIIELRDVFSTILLSDRDSPSPEKQSIRDLMEKVLEPYIDMSDRDFVKIAQKAVNDLFDWTMQTQPKGLNAAIKRTLLGTETEKSAIEQIMEFVNKVKKNENHPLFNNMIINGLAVDKASKNGHIDALYIVDKINKMYDQNRVIDSFNEIKENLGIEKGDLYNKLLRVIILQSGLSHSHISLTHLIPYKDFKLIYNDVLSAIEEVPYLQDFYNLNVFQRNNWSNDDIVPLKRASLVKFGKNYWMNMNEAHVNQNLKDAMNTGVIPKVINVDINSQEGNYDVIVYSWQDKIGKQEAIKRRKKGNRAHMHKGLFQKVYTEENGKRVPLIQVDRVEVKDKETKKKTGEIQIYYKYVYKMINAWGDSFRAQEFYNTEQASVLDNEFEKVERKTNADGHQIASGEVSDDKIFDIFNGDVEIQKLSSVRINNYIYTTQQELMNIDSQMLKAEGLAAEEINNILKQIGRQPLQNELKNNTSNNFQGYKGGFENVGKGTPQGDGKDKAMRKIADGFIGEVSENRESSTLTSYKEISGKTLEESKEIAEQRRVITWIPENPKIIMLARNGSLKGQKLNIANWNTKEYIKSAMKAGAEFVVGDMPNVDSQFIDYLQEINAKFTVYHTGNTPRINLLSSQEKTDNWQTQNNISENPFKC